MTRFGKNWIAALLGVFLMAGLIAPMAARASETGRKNTTLAAGAITGYFLLHKQWVPAAIAGVGTYAAYHNWQAQINARHRRQRALAYRSRYSSHSTQYGRVKHHHRRRHHRRH